MAGERKPPPEGLESPRDAGRGSSSEPGLQKVVYGPGDRLGAYEILDLLGTGGMGRVYLARDTTLKRKVALKALAMDLTSDPSALERWRREAETVAALNHPNIVTLYSVEELGDSSFLAMELVEGRSIDRIIQPKGLSLKEFFRIAIPLTDGLGAAHQQGIAHRDLKPSNIMMSSEGRLKVLDFGMAKLVSEAGEGLATLTRKGAVVGTLPYMSPQQVEGLPIDLRTDIFSLGVVLYEMATGRRPFVADSFPGLAYAITTQTPTDIASLRSDLPRHLSRVVSRCLEKEPGRRYQTAIDVHNELQALKREVDTGVRSSSVRYAESPDGWEKKLGVYGLRIFWGLLLPIVALSGLLGKLVMWGLERQVGAQIIDSTGLAQKPLFWASSFLEQALTSSVSAAPLGGLRAAGLLVVLLNLLLLIARPPERPPPADRATGRWAAHYDRLYYVLVLPLLTALAVKVFLAPIESVWWLAAFLPLTLAHLYYLFSNPEDLLSGHLPERACYLLISLVWFVFALFIPYRYGRDFFDVQNPPVVERAQPLGAAGLESFERGGEMTVVIDSGDNVLATIELSDQGKLVSLSRVEQFDPRAQSKSLRELLTSIEDSERQDARAIAAQWVGN